MRTYMVVIDETPEAEVALRFAARRAAKTGGGVLVLAIVPPTEFVGLGEVQATIEEEAREHAEEMVASAASILTTEAGVQPTIVVKLGEAAPLVRETLAEHPDVAALVLGAAAVGPPGPLIAHFAGAEAGQLPCPVMVIPGGLDSATIDRLS